MTGGIRTFCLILLAIFVSSEMVFCQGQRIADSLRPIYLADSLTGLKKLELLRDLSFYESIDLIKAEQYSQELIDYARQFKHPESQKYIYRGYRNKGYALEAQGKLFDALMSFYEAQRAAKKAGFHEGDAMSKLTIAGITASLGDSYNSDVFYQQSIADWERIGDKLYLCMSLTNAADAALNFKKYEQAKEYLDRAQTLLEELKAENDPDQADELSQFDAYIKGILGIYHAETGDIERGGELLENAIVQLEPYMDYQAIGEFQLALAKVLLKEGKISEAKNLANSSLEYATDLKRKTLVGKANKLLAELAEKEGNPSEALEFRKISNSIDDELLEMREQSVQHFVSLVQEQLNSENEILLGEQKINRQQTLILLTAVVLLLIALLTVGIYGRYRYIRNTNKIISEEKDRSDGLLLNILPKDTAEELKSQGHVQAKKYNQVTVMFTDFLGFTRYADHLPPEELVKAVDYYFSQFDLIMEKHGIEKIKTVGDAYLCAAGLPDPSLDHAERIIRAALDIIELVKKAKHDENDLTRFDVRIGISTGPVVAGVVGSKKFAYDIWGDTVNIASRMETNSEPMCINVSEYTYELTKDMFSFIPRGKLDVKNKGKMQMYFVDTVESREQTQAVPNNERVKFKS